MEEIKKIVDDLLALHLNWISSWNNHRKKILEQRGLMEFYQDYEQVGRLMMRLLKLYSMGEKTFILKIKKCIEWTPVRMVVRYVKSVD